VATDACLLLFVEYRSVLWLQMLARGPRVEEGDPENGTGPSMLLTARTVEGGDAAATEDVRHEGDALYTRQALDFRTACGIVLPPGNQ
jgi:hypothetical protein